MPELSPPSPVPQPRSGPRFVTVIRLLILGSLAGGTAWHALARPALREAHAAFDHGDFSTALEFALDDEAGHPRSRESTLLAARSLSRLRYADEAEPFYRRAFRGASPDLESLRDRATGLLQSARFDRAVVAFRSLVERFPQDSISLRYLATLELTHGRMTEALATAEQLARTPEGRGDGLALIRDIHHEAKRPTQAVEAGEALLRFDPELNGLRYDRVMFWIEMTADLLSIHRIEQAAEMLRPIVERMPDVRLLDLLATCYRRLGEIDQAERYWKQAAAIDPHRANPPLQLGMLAMSRKQYDEAARDFEKATANDPSAVDPAYNLAQSYRALGRTEDASRVDRTVEMIRRKTPPPPGGMGSTP